MHRVSLCTYFDVRGKYFTLRALGKCIFTLCKFCIASTTVVRGAPNTSNFTSRSCARPRQSTPRVARHAYKLQLYHAFARSTTRHASKLQKVATYLAFLRSTMPIHGKGCASSCNFTSRSCARPRH